MKTTIDIIQNHILGEIFTDFPTDLDTNAFDFFLRADVDCTEDVSMSPLGTEWGFEICEAYELDNIRSIRGLMQSMFDGLYELKNKLFNNAVKRAQISLDDFVDCNTFYDFIQSGNGILHRQGTADEYATFLTVDAEAVL